MIADQIQDGRVAPRSGLAAKNFIDTGAGVIDADYRGEVKVLLFNFSDEDFTGMIHWLGSLDDGSRLTHGAVKQGDRIAQLIIERVLMFFPLATGMDWTNLARSTPPRFRSWSNWRRVCVVPAVSAVPGGKEPTLEA